MANQLIAVINQSTVVTDAEVQRIAEALSLQSADYESVWGHGAVFAFRDKSAPSVPGTWELVILDDSDQMGALGYHELTSAGDPIGYCFAKTTIGAGESWTVCASHEAWEMVEDPYINTVAQNPVSSGTRDYAFEVCDACEDDQFAYEFLVDGIPVLVSDFVTPRWFVAGESGPFDFKGHVSAPLQILAGGYIGYLDVGSGSWQQLTDDRARVYKAHAKPGHRRHRRMLPRASWRRSKAQG